MARRRPKTGEGKYFSSLCEKAGGMGKEGLAILVRQKYHLAGNHSAAKLCHWAKASLQGKGECYKSRFYGIKTHRCLQCTPCLQFCNHDCVFCWRALPWKGLEAIGKGSGGFSWGEPEKLVDALLEEQARIMSGFKGNPKVGKGQYDEAKKPAHAAISLSGEPCMYPHLGRLLGEFHSRGMTTFLVTNGTFPGRLAALEEPPTQLYVSMVAPNEEVYRKAIRPSSPKLWENYWETLRLLPKLGKRTRTVLRMTLARGINDSDFEGYAAQIKEAQPHYVEVKSMVFVGGARDPKRGLSLGSMLSMGEIEGIAGKLAALSGYFLADSHAPSRVALLCRDKKAADERKLKLADG